MAGLDGYAVPGSPGAVQFADVRQLVVGPGGDVPPLPHAVADELQEAGSSTHLDQEAGDGVTLPIKAHQVLGIILDHEESSERQLTAAGEQVDGDLIVSLPFELILAEQ